MRVRRIALVLILAALASSATAELKGWVSISDCRLEKNAANDGDSFHVKHESGSYLFRLYFVDCPETNRQIPSRVRQQAEYWETDEESVLARGREAVTFTGKALRRPFTIHTKWQDAKGKSRAKRFFAFVTTGEGKDLAAALVRAGLARAYGASVAHPDGTSTRGTWKRLDDLEEEAKESGRGCWAR